MGFAQILQLLSVYTDPVRSPTFYAMQITFILLIVPTLI